jgi:23S rRNA (uracil1939-C5)-methyltransferase/tRNA (uracil-5-)-methyltransferase
MNMPLDKESTNRAELQIIDVVYPGKGLAKLDGRVVFVRGALQGETVSVKIVRKQKRFFEAALLEVISPSPHRIEPVCPLAGVCPGCMYQHVDYAHEIEIKQGQLTNTLGHKLKVDESVFGEPVASPDSLGYRNKITLHARLKEGRAPVIGYVGWNNRTVLEVDQCPLAMDPLNNLLKELRADQALMWSLKGRDTIALRCTDQDGAIGRAKSQGAWRSVTSGFSGGTLTESTVLGPLDVPRWSFFQVNPKLCDLLLTGIGETVKEEGPTYLIDLYSGVGVFALAAARAGVPHVLGIERDRRAVKAARRNASTLKCNDIEFMEGDTEVMVADALSAVDMGNTSVIVDPPRRGLEVPTRDALCKLKPRQLIYISCAPDTLTRDLGPLLAAGYSIERCTLYDMFPRTSAFETMTVLRQKTG